MLQMQPCHVIKTKTYVYLIRLKQKQCSIKIRLTLLIVTLNVHVQGGYNTPLKHLISRPWVEF